MPAMAAPLSAGKLEPWQAFADQLTGPRQAEFDDMNRRHDLTDHRAYLQPTPDGNYLTLVVIEGPGADAFFGTVTQSGHDFDRWFVESIVELHEFDLSGPPPPMGERRI